MTLRLAEIHRHPIKSHGRESLASVLLSEGASLPWDRRWAVAHEAARLDRNTPAWVPCANFSRGAKAPSLMAINSVLDEAEAAITLSHPERPDFRFHPDQEGEVGGFIDWVLPISPANRALPAGIFTVPGRGMTDTDYPSVSLINLASNADLSRTMGVALSPMRWRGNLWLEGLAAWAEFDLIGKRLRVGEAVLEVVEPITRCKATSANPATGRLDADTLAGLAEGPGHQEFGVYARVVETGRIAAGDPVGVL